MFIRTVVVISYFATLSLITGILIIKNRPKSENVIYIFTATVFFIYSSILIVRILVWLLFPSVREVFNSAFINSFQFFASMVIDILWTTLFFVINNQRLNLCLKESNTKYSLIFNHSFAGILLINQEGRYFDINPAFCRITGYSFDEIFDKPVGFLTHPEDSDKIKKALKDLLTGKIDTYNDKTRIINKSGAITWLTLNAKIYKSDEILQFIQVEIFDITTQVEMEQIMFDHNEKLATAKNMAEKANKAKSEFLSNMSHEIRTPLNGILGFTGILLEEENNKEKRDMLKLMEQSGKMLLNIIDDILSLSKIEAGKYSLDKRRVNLTNFLSTLSEIYKKQATSKDLNFFLNTKIV